MPPSTAPLPVTAPAVSLFTPLKQRGVTLRNRIAMSPMCQYSCREDGLAQDWHLAHLGARATGGAALVIAEATAVSPEGRITPADLGLWSDRQIAPLARIVRFIASQGAAAGIQLAHAGRKASHRPPAAGGGPLATAAGGWLPVGPSPLAFAPGDAEPSELDGGGLGTIIAAFAAAARRAVEAGFSVIEVHAAHGYLLHEFLSPLSNQRTDAHGGSLANRLRFPLDVVRAVRTAVPSTLPVWVRVSASDWVAGGWDLAQTIAFAAELRTLGVDLIDVSSGGSSPQAVVPALPGYQVPFATAIRRDVGIATGAVGLITEAAQAARLIADGDADMVLLGRQLLREPYWPLHAALALGVPITWPTPYARAAPPRG
jgi:2,4-dienoyl-CoA reductase-like NADH-dependent reductase (Old Yellow Enzyme family)